MLRLLIDRFLGWFDSLTLRDMVRTFAVLGIISLGLAVATDLIVIRRGPFVSPFAPSLFLQIFGFITAGTLILGAIKIIRDVQKESEDYAKNISGSGASEQAPEILRLLSKLQESSSQQIKDSVRQLRAELEIVKVTPIDTSDPDKLFQIGRQRLLDEAVRIDSISRRNLVIGILFSFIALGTLAWPLIAQGLLQPSTDTDAFGVMPWFARYYLPRFAVGLLLQFVGFFFLRLYVANELDLKHNKNEITNYEMKMMGLQLARSNGDAASRKEVIKSLVNTERNFILKKNEKSVSNEALTEYNDLRSLIDKLVSKIPGVGKK